MKRICSILASLTLALSLTACNPGEPQGSGVSVPSPVQSGSIITDSGSDTTSPENSSLSSPENSSASTPENSSVSMPESSSESITESSSASTPESSSASVPQSSASSEQTTVQSSSIVSSASSSSSSQRPEQSSTASSQKPEESSSSSSSTQPIQSSSTVPVSSSTPSPIVPETKKTLVAYFSWGGRTEGIAKNIIANTGADEFRIERLTAYSNDYSTVAYGEAKDEADSNARPPIKDPLASIDDYDKIILCYPIWWHTCPMTVGTFLNAYDFRGITIYPVSQSDSMNRGQYAESLQFIKDNARNAAVDDGVFSRNQSEIDAYISGKVIN